MSSEATNSGWGPQMRAEEHVGTYNAFITGAKYGGGAIAVLLILMAIFLL